MLVILESLLLSFAAIDDLKQFLFFIIFFLTLGEWF
jgi:hypothetical protein